MHRSIVPLACGTALALACFTPATALAQSDPGMWNAALPAPPPPPPPLPEPSLPGPLRPAGSSWQFGATLLGSVYTIQYPTLGSDSGGNHAYGSLAATHFLTPVIDDDGPRSLQPFLQRTSTLQFSLGGGGFETRPPGAQSFGDRTFDAKMGVDVYVSRYVALDVSLAYGFGSQYPSGSSHHTISPTGGIGLRFGDVRIDATYTFSATSQDGSFLPLEWGTVGLSIYAVLSRWVVLNPAGHVFPGGGSGGASIGFYPTKDVALWATGYGGRGERYVQRLVSVSYGGSGEIAYWFSPIFRLGLTYYADVVDVPEQSYAIPPYHQVEHSFELAASLRPR